MITPGGDHLKLTGQLGDVWQGSGLDGDLALYLDAAGEVRQLLPARWRILEHMKLSSTVAGSLAAPVLKDLSAAIAGPGGSDLKLAGTLRLAADDPVVLEGFDLGATLAVPDPAAFQALLGFDPAPLGPVQGEASLSLADGRLEISGLNARSEPVRRARARCSGADRYALGGGRVADHARALVQREDRPERATACPAPFSG